jgi:drug/metabolite transporter (DMT)-like permease
MAAVTGYWFWNEVPGLWFWPGAALIVAAGIIAARSERTVGN